MHRGNGNIDPLLNGWQQVCGQVRHALHALSDFVSPPNCLVCHQTIGTHGQLCPTCWSSLQFIEKPHCAVLGTPFSYDQGEGALSADAIASPPVFDTSRSVVLYGDSARRLIHGLKFSDRCELAPWMARWMVRAGKEILSTNAVVVPVPLHPWRLLGRRFNQSAELGRNIAAQTGLSYRPQLLRRIKNTRQQVGLGSKARMQNVRGAFQVAPHHGMELAGRHVVLVDDVFTTGATLQACARVLRLKGASRIDCLTFARVASGVADGWV